MKKLSLIFLCFIVALLSGCVKKSSDVKPITSGLSFYAEYEKNSLKYKYFVEIKKDQTEINVIKPENIKDTRFIFTNQNCKVTFNGIDTDLKLRKDDDFIPQFIYKAFSNTDNANIITENNKIYLTLNSEKLSFNLYISDLGLPIKLENPENNTKIIIKNATIIN